MPILINAQQCTGCRICELVCSFRKHGEFNPKRSRIRIVKMERILVDIPVVCRQCPEPPCLANCPVDALKKDGAMAVDEALCTGCMSCREACPFDALSLDPVSGTAAVCDLCQGDPQCVKWCPTGALAFSSSEAPAPVVKRDTVAGTARSLLANWGIGWEEYEKYYGESNPDALVKSKLSPPLAGGD